MTAVRSETATIRVVELDRPPRFAHDAGQFVALRLSTDEGPDLRPLSIASPPGSPSIQLATRLGPSAFKRAYGALQPGDAVKVSRPMGSFRLDPARPAVIISGGVGITPVRSMLLDALAHGYAHPIRLLFSNRDAAEVPYEGELAELAFTHPNLEITHILTAKPGYISTQLHRGIAGSSTFLNTAVWETVAAFRGAFGDPDFQSTFERYPDTTVASPHLFQKPAVPGICIDR